jgi:hypothetical protein
MSEILEYGGTLAWFVFWIAVAMALILQPLVIIAIYFVARGIGRRLKAIHHTLEMQGPLAPAHQRDAATATSVARAMPMRGPGGR